MKLIDKLNAEVKENIKSSKSSKKLLFKFKAEHYRKTLSNRSGFGVTDLKPTYFALYMVLINKYKAKLITELGDVRQKEVVVSFKA